MTETLTLPTTGGATSPPVSAEHLSPVLARYFQTTWSRGKGHTIWDADGKAYLDFACGIATTVLGHGEPRVLAAAQAQLDQLWHVCNGLGYVEPVSQLADAICGVMPAPLDRVFFGNSGTEAIEGSIKLARRVTGRSWIIGFANAFHGRTYASMSLTSSNLNYRVGHGPLLPNTYIAPFPSAYRGFDDDEETATAACTGYLDSVFSSQISPNEVAAFLIEPVQGEGGYTPAPIAFLQALRRTADRHGILLIADEVQSGYGRTGSMWGFQRADIVPDIVTLAKAIANGLPLSAIVASHELMDRWGKGAHGSTFGGNPVACAAGVAVLDVIRDDGLVANAAARGAELRTELQAIAAQDPRIGDIRGPGLMIGVELVTDRGTKEPAGPLADAVIAACLDRGLVLLTCGPAHNVVRWIPPLNVTSQEIDTATAIFRDALAATA